MIAAAANDAVFGRLLLSLAVVLAVGRAAGALGRRVGQPAVVGEIVAGIALGPSLLGLIAPGLPAMLFPAEVVVHLKVVAEVGLVLFMFAVGLELDPAALRASGRQAGAVAAGSMILPFALGVGALAPLLHRGHHLVAGREVGFTPFALFVGVAMSGTAFAVLARILAEHDLLGTRLGTLLLSSAAIDDVVAFALLGVVVAIASSSGAGGGLLLTLAALVGMVALLVFVVRPLLRRTVLRRACADGRLDGPVLGALLLGALLTAYVATRIGLHPMMGAFAFGTCVPCDRGRRLPHEVTQRLEAVSVHLLMPAFFVVTGLGVNVAALRRSDIVPALAIVAVACVGKFVGSMGAARAVGMPHREALAVGTMMNARGLAELVILSAGREAGVLDDRLFTMLVVMAVVTTVMAGPLLRLVYPERMLRAQRSARAASVARSSLVAAA